MKQPNFDQALKDLKQGMGGLKSLLESIEPMIQDKIIEVKTPEQAQKIADLLSKNDIQGKLKQAREGFKKMGL